MNVERPTILVTGASRGIGHALVAHYLKNGAYVIAAARNVDSATANSGDCLWVQTDLSTSEGCEKVIRYVGQTGRPLDVVIHNAGMQQEIDLTDAAGLRPQIEAELSLNLVAPAVLSKSLVPFIRQPGGVIVNVTSLVSRAPKPSAPIYSASKAGLASFSKSLRHQLRPLGINVVEAVPPLVATDMTAGRGKRKMTPEAMAEAIAQGVTLGRAQVAPGLSGLVLALNRFAPGVVERVLRSS